jgi:hypothetical protein
MTADQKKWIDNASYEELLRKWRYASVGDPMFIGDTGDYYKEIMLKKRDELNVHPSVISKRVGWEK